MKKFSRKWKAYGIAQEIACFVNKHGYCKGAAWLIAGVQDAETRKHVEKWICQMLS